MHIKDHCSPSESDNKYSCLDDDLILEIAKILNTTDDINIDLKLSPEEIHNVHKYILQRKHENMNVTSKKMTEDGAMKKEANRLETYRKNQGKNPMYNKDSDG